MDDEEYTSAGIGFTHEDGFLQGEATKVGGYDYFQARFAVKNPATGLMLAGSHRSGGVGGPVTTLGASKQIVTFNEEAYLDAMFTAEDMDGRVTIAPTVGLTFQPTKNHDAIRYFVGLSDTPGVDDGGGGWEPIFGVDMPLIRP